jgi:hypothetical protein
LRRPELERVNLLEIAPVRTADWRESGERVVLHRPPPRTRGVRRLFDHLATWLAPPKIRLDEVGSFAWKRLDGSVTVGEVAESMRRELDVDAAEERLGRFVRDLHRDGFLAYPGWDELPPGR